MERKKRILVLGADGFLGSHITEALSEEKNSRVRAFDLFKDGETKNLSHLKNKVEIFQGNFLNREDLTKALSGIDYVFHLVSLTTPGSSMNDPLIDIETNIRGTVVFLEECAKANIKKVIFASSGGGVYGNQGKGIYKEDDALSPISPYAISKSAIEYYLEYFRINRGLDYLVFRYSNPYGPKQNIYGTQGIVPIFLNLIKRGEPITVFGDGKNIRDFIYIDDLARMTALLYSRKTKYRVYNIGGGKGKSINEVISVMREVTGKKIKVNKLPARSVDVRKTVLDISRIEKELPKISKTSFKIGVKKTWEWINNHHA